MKPTYILILLFLTLSPPLLFSQSGFYIGGSAGTAFVDAKVSETTEADFSFNKNNFAWKLYGGLQLTDFLSAEGGFRNTGKAENKVSGVTLSTSTKGWDVVAVGKMNLLMVQVFAKAGLFFQNTENSFDSGIPGGSGTEDETGSVFLWGFGAGLQLGTIGIRAEWENLSVKIPENLSMLSVGVTMGL